MARILGIDYGERRIGVATSDETGRMATNPLPTLDRKQIRGSVEEAIAALAAEWEVAEIVVGLPVNMDGSHGPAAQKVQEFAGNLAEVSGLPVATWDERLTSVMAQQVQIDLGIPKGKRREKGRLDRAAAQLLLQNYLDWRARQAENADGE